MKLKISNFIFSLLLVFAYQLQAQVVSKKDSVAKDFLPTGIRIGVDVINPVKDYLTKDFKGWEVQGDIDFRNYYLTAEIGSWARDVALKNGNYTNDGNYWKAGVDVNFMKKDPDKNMFFLGFRVAHSKYDEGANYFIDSTAFGRVDKSLTNIGMKSNWMELTAGLKIRIFKGFWMGYTARIKLFPSFSEDQPLQTYDVPGYGLTFKKPWWGLNYYLLFRIPVRQK